MSVPSKQELRDLPSKAGLVAELLRDEIKRGELAPGAVLRQRDIATRFGVSPTPVREALSRLEAEGYVSSTPHRGATVVRQERARVEENYRIRATLESLAAELATPRLVDADFETLEAINKAIAAYKRVTPKVIELNRQFHMTIYEATDSPLLLRMLTQLWRALEGGPRVTRSPEVSVTEHAQLLVALRKRDADSASALVRSHILSSVPVLETEG